MLNLILLAKMVSSECYWGYYTNPSGSDPACLKCNEACGNCDGPTEFDCIQCSRTYSSIEGICMANCPLGFQKQGAGSCTSSSSDGVVYSLDFTKISNSVEDKVNLNAAKIVVSAGSTGSFYPYYDDYDPYTIRYRGFYFDGSAYLKNEACEVTFGPVFTVAMWIRPMSGNGYLFVKQNSSNINVGIKIENYYPNVQFFMSSVQTFSGVKALSNGKWGFLMVKMLLDTGYKAKVSITVDTTTATSSTYSTYYKDIYNDFYTTYGAQYSGGSFLDYFNGYMWSFMIGNQDVAASNFIQTSSCSGGCSICPTDNSNACLSSCSSTQYIESDVCKDCRSSCQVFGCVRDDKSCNLCYDRLCANCTTFEAGCTYCIKNAYLESSTKCVCYEGYIWDEEEEICKPCVKNCKTCNGGGYLGCSECKDGYYMLWGICYSICPTGYSVSGKTCALTGSKRILDMIFNKVQGVVYDSVNSIPAVTGSSSTFYPDYESNDPIAAYSRGYYFRGNSLMNFAPYSTYTSPYLIFSSVFYVGIWFNPSIDTGILYSSVNPDYNVILQYSIQALRPRLVIGFYNLTSESFDYPSTSCKNLATLKAWNYILFKLTLSDKGKTSITCYINKVEETSQEVGKGFLFDSTNQNYMLAGTQKTNGGYDSGYYKGFIFHIVVDVDIDFPNKEISSDCTGGCPYCISGGDCLPECNISHYQSGSKYNECSACDDNCKEKGCRDISDTCNICGDKGCKVCYSYSEEDCSDYYCKSGQYSDSATSECKDCDASCGNCTAAGPANCRSCTTGFLLNKACHSFCPTGYSIDSKTCTLTLSHILSLNLHQIKGVVPDSQSNFEALAGSSSSFYPNFDSSDPWPQIYRGYYFNGVSYLQLPPNANDSSLITFGNAWVVTFWIRAESDGTVFVKQKSDYGYCLRAILTGNKVKVELQLNDLAVVTTDKSLGNIWNYVIIRVRFENTGDSSVQVIINGESQMFDAGSGAYADLKSSFTMTIGAQKSSDGYSSNFTGFLYSFDIYSTYATISDYSSTCDTSDFTCTVCPSATSSCIDLCNYNYWYNGNNCQKCQDSSYNSCRRNDKSCNLCKDVQCKICDTFDSGSCSECRPHAVLSSGECDCDDGYVWSNSEEACIVCDTSKKVKLQGVCLDFCPTGYTASNGKCTGDPAKIFNIEMDKNILGTVPDTVNGQISVLTGPTSEFYPYYDEEDPYAGKDRGYYYNGYSSYTQFVTSSDNNKQLVLSPEFSISFWIYPVSSGVIFTKQTGYSTNIKIEILDSQKVKVSALLSTQASLSSMTSNMKVNYGDWNFVGVTCKLSDDISTQITIQINNTKHDQSLGTGAYIDPSSSYSAFLGAELNSSNLLTNYYTGYINSMTVWNSGQDLSSQVSTSCTGNCAFCPLTGKCLPDCGLFFYFDSTCKSCNSFCKQGCVRNEDCNLCYDRLCEVCSNYTSTGCSKCVDGAEKVSGTCQCKTGSTKTKQNGNLYCATDCQSECESCYSSFQGECISCKDGYFLDVYGLCVSQCPTGSSLQGKKCVQNSGKVKILHYVFNTTVNSPEDKTAKLKAFMGSTSQYIGNYDENDPIAYYKRGIYFNGQQKYVQLPPNPAESSYVILGNLHSIKFWLRAKSSSSSGTLAVKESSSGAVVHLYLDNLIPKVSYKLRDIYSTNEKTLSAQASALTAGVWYELVFVLKRSGRSTTGIFFVNGKRGQKSYTTKSFLYETKDLEFKLGYSESQSSSYTGFIYEFIIFNYELSPNDPSSNPCWCSLCTAEGDCLVDCETNQYIKDHDTCSNCPSECPSGCRSESNCGQNEDGYCEEYSGFEMKQCTKCKKLAKFTSSGCKCVENSSLINGLCTCNQDYEEVDNVCEACFYHLQSSEVEGYFSEDYLSLIFNLTQAVRSSSSSDCSKLFTPETFSLFGDSPKCSWLKSFTMLKVLLGFDAQVVNETEIWFAKNSLLTSIKTCGSFRGPISEKVYFKYDIPQIIPTAFIDAPPKYSVNCGDMVVSGTKSSGGHGRRLKFEWQFVSKPEDDVFNISDMTQSSYLFRNHTVSPGKLTASLEVKNWLGFSDDAQKVVVLTTDIVIELIVDSDISFEMTTQMSKSIFVKAFSPCGISNDLTFTWSLLDKEGKDARVDQQLLWGSQKSQSKLYIPKGALGPGRYFFKVTAHDNELGSDGETVLVLNVVYSDLQILFNPEYKTVNRLKDLTLDGSVAFDPDQTTDPESFLWNCSDNCDALIEKSDKQVTFIKKENLENLKEYQFTLTYTKGSRSASAILTVQVNDSSKISVKFTRVPEYINNQENFIIISSLDPPCNCSYFWEVLSGGKYELNTEATGKDVGFAPYSMSVGSKYKVQLTVSDSDGSESRFQQNFKVNVPPKGGSLKISKSSGVELDTLFKLQATGWSDFENSSWPLTYQFGYYKENTAYYVNVRNESNFFFTQLPTGTPLEVFVRVYDIHGSFSEKTIDVQVASSNIFAEDLMQEFENFLNSNKLDAETLVGYLTNLAWAFRTHEFNESYQDQAFNLSLLSIEELKGTMQDIDFSKIDVLFSLTAVVTLYDLDFEKRLSLYQLLSSYTQLISDEVVIMSTARADRFVDILLKLVEFTPTTVVDSAEDLYQANEILKALAMASSVSMAQTQWMVFGKSPIECYVKLYKGDDIPSFRTPDKLNSTLIALPVDPSLMFLSSSTIMTVLNVYNWDPELYLNNSEEHSAAVEFTLIEIVNFTQTILDIQLEDGFINVSVPIWNVDKFPPKCVYWRTDDWSRKGCKLAEFEGNRSICSCSHTSLYTSGSHFGTDSDGDDDGGPILIYLVCLVALLWIFLACCLVVKDRKESESKVFVAKIIAALPPAGKKTPGYIENQIADQLGRGEKDEKKGTLHVPPAKFAVVGGEVKEYESQKALGYSEIEEPKSEDVVKGRKLTLPLGYQILPGAEFSKNPAERPERPERPEKVEKVEKYEKVEKNENNERVKMQIMPMTVSSKSDLPESEKAAGFAFKAQAFQVSEFPNTEQNVRFTGKDVEKAPTGPGFAGYPKSDPTSGTSSNIGRRDSKDGRGPQVAVVPLNQDEKSGFSYSQSGDGFVMQKFAQFEEFRSEQGGSAKGNLPRGSQHEIPSVQMARLGGVTNLESGKDSRSETRNISYAVPSRDLRLTEYEPRPGTDGKYLLQNLSGVSPRNEGVRKEIVPELSQDESPRLPDQVRHVEYISGPKLPGLTELNMENSEGFQRPGPSGNNPGLRLGGFTEMNLESPEGFQRAPGNSAYNPAPRLGGLTEMNLESFEASQRAHPAPGQGNFSYNPAPRLAGLTEMKFENSEGYQRPPGPGQGNFAYNPAPRLAGLTEMNLDDSSQHPGKLSEHGQRIPAQSDVNYEAGKGTQAFYSSNYRLAAPTDLKIIESQNFATTGKSGQGDPGKESLESPNFGSEKKPFLFTAEKESNVYESSAKGSKISGHKLEKRTNDRNPTQAYEENVGKGKIAELEEAKQENPEGRNLKRPAESDKFPENTELFTQPDSPNNRNLRRKKGVEQEVPMFEENEEIRYPGFIADYFFSAVFYYHENYSRFSRCAQGVCSFLLQTILIGVILSGMGNSYAEDKGRSFGTLLGNLMFQDVAVAFSMVIVSNLLLGALLCLFFRRPPVVSGSEEVRGSRKKEFFGLFIMLLIIFGTVIAVALLEMSMDHMFSVLWVICLFIGFLFDFFCIQLIKVLVFNYFSPGLILPVS